MGVRCEGVSVKQGSNIARRATRGLEQCLVQTPQTKQLCRHSSAAQTRQLIYGCLWHTINAEDTGIQGITAGVS